MKNLIRLISAAAALLALLVISFSGCANASKTEYEIPDEPGIYINGKAVAFAEEGNTDLPLLSVEKGITIQVVKAGKEKILVNGEKVRRSVHLDVSAITADEVIEFEITDGDTVVSHTVSLLPAAFPAYSVEGESAAEGDYYLTTYDLPNNYLMKLNSKGELIFYMAVTKTDDEGNEVNTNALDFRKYYNADGAVRYTYMPYLEDAFADGDCGGINPGCVRVMDENYNLIDTIYYIDENGEDVLIDPHGCIWLDDGHYILAAYKQEVLAVPEELGAQDNTADLAVLYLEEVQDGEVLWEFRSADYEQFLAQSNSIVWENSAEKCSDYVHFNSMSIDQDGNLLVSCRHLNSILKISRTDGSLMWQLGGADDEFGLTEDQKFSYQHSIIVTDDGSYMIFDNANEAVKAGRAEYSSVVRIKVDEESRTVSDYTRYNVVEFFSNYMGAIRELDSEAGIYLWSVGGNYTTDKETPPAWSMVEYTEQGDGALCYNLRFRYNEGTGRLYCSNKCG